MAKYKLLRGLHQEGKYPEKNSDGTKHPDAGKPITYRPGDIIDTTVKLLGMNSPGAIKFQLIEADSIEGNVALPIGPAAQLEQKLKEQETAQPETPEASDGLEEMTVAALRTYAEESEISLGGATKKDDILSAIRNVPVTA